MLKLDEVRIVKIRTNIFVHYPAELTDVNINLIVNTTQHIHGYMYTI